MNVVKIEEALSDQALQPFDAAEFPFAFLSAFGNKDTALKCLRTGNNNASDVPGGVLQRNNKLPLARISTINEIKDNPVDVRATRLPNKLHVECYCTKTRTGPMTRASPTSATTSAAVSTTTRSGWKNCLSFIQRDDGGQDQRCVENDKWKKA